MYFINARQLISECVANGVLHTIDGDVVIYREQGSSEEFPAGWYKESIDDLARELMEDEVGQEALIGALREKGVEFKPLYDPIRWFGSSRAKIRRVTDVIEVSDVHDKRLMLFVLYGDDIESAISYDVMYLPETGLMYVIQGGPEPEPTKEQERDILALCKDVIRRGGGMQ